ncbi:MAG: hypothetical protein ACRC8B_20170 [Aeromonas sobria]|uniref:hypothetical protein n=1 Tax=Aeromonas sobria TaxID=646 RepID=UPI003F3F0FE5
MVLLFRLVLMAIRSPYRLEPVVIPACRQLSFLFLASFGDTPYFTFIGFFLPIQWFGCWVWRKAGSAVPPAYFPLLLA